MLTPHTVRDVMSADTVAVHPHVAFKDIVLLFAQHTSAPSPSSTTIATSSAWSPRPTCSPGDRNRCGPAPGIARRAHGHAN